VCFFFFLSLTLSRPRNCSNAGAWFQQSTETEVREEAKKKTETERRTGQKKEEQDHTILPASAAAGRAMAPRHAAWTTTPSTKKIASHDPDAAKLQDPACRKNPHEEHTRTLLLLLPSPQCRLLISTFPNASATLPAATCTLITSFPD
jgi:hypothetical protein